VAKVKDVQDPLKMGRVRVQFPWQKQDQVTPWILISSVHADWGKGFYFVPELVEGVLVGFEGNDAEKPYIIGSIRNRDEKADKDWVTGSNDIKSIPSHSGHTIEFNDTEGKEELCICNGTKNDPASMMRLKVSNQGFEIFSKGPIRLASDSYISPKGKNILVEASEKLDLLGHETVYIANKVGKERGMTFWDAGGVQLNFSEEAKFVVAIGSSEKMIEATIEGLKISGTNVETRGEAVTTIKGGLVQIN